MMRRDAVIAAMIGRIKDLFRAAARDGDGRGRARKPVAGNRVALEAETKRRPADADDHDGDP